jgi:hypothetical protein
VKISFRGSTKNQESLVGECIQTSVTGIAYYFFSWTTEKDAGSSTAEFQDAKKRAKVLKINANWKETAPKGREFSGVKLAYKLIDAESIWKQPKESAPADQDPDCDLYLDAEYTLKGKRTDFKPRAEVLVYILNGSKDPANAGLEFLKNRKSRNPELYKEFKFEEVKDAVIGDEPQATPPGELLKVTRLKLNHEENTASSKFIVFSVKQMNDKLVVVEGICPWSDRSIWEQRLMNLVGSLQ